MTDTITLPHDLLRAIELRLPDIEATVRFLTDSGELRDYDDEMHADLHEAVRFLKSIRNAARTPEPDWNAGMAAGVSGTL